MDMQNNARNDINILPLMAEGFIDLIAHVIEGYHLLSCGVLGCQHHEHAPYGYPRERTRSAFGSCASDHPRLLCS